MLKGLCCQARLAKILVIFQEVAVNRLNRQKLGQELPLECLGWAESAKRFSSGKFPLGLRLGEARGRSQFFSKSADKRGEGMFAHLGAAIRQTSRATDRLD